jgi:multidrug efflux pump
MWEVGANDQIFKAIDYAPLIVAYRNGRPCASRMWAEGGGLRGGPAEFGLCQRQAVGLVVIFRQPGANIIDTVDRIRAMLPQFKASIPQSIDMQVAMDQTVTIRASVHDVERTLSSP